MEYQDELFREDISSVEFQEMLKNCRKEVERVGKHYGIAMYFKDNGDILAEHHPMAGQAKKEARHLVRWHAAKFCSKVKLYQIIRRVK